MASANDQSGKGERTEAKRLKRKRTKKKRSPSGQREKRTKEEGIANWPKRKRTFTSVPAEIFGTLSIESYKILNRLKMLDKLKIWNKGLGGLKNVETWFGLCSQALLCS